MNSAAPKTVNCCRNTMSSLARTLGKRGGHCSSSCLPLWGKGDRCAVDEARGLMIINYVQQIMPACGARRNLRVTAVTVLDFFRPLRFPRFASSALGGNPQPSESESDTLSNCAMGRRNSRRRGRLKRIEESAAVERNQA